jgi:glycosyltransferase involved in cell wall biosynthesis
MKLALSMLCENPHRRTGLTTLFHEFVSRSLRLYPDLQWLLFAGPNQEWTINHPRLELNQCFPANDRLKERLIADHFQMPVAAKRSGADALITVGFVPIRKSLPTAMHVFSLQHLDRQNRVGFGRELYRKWLTKFSWPRADLVITNSQFAAAQIRSVYPELGNRLIQSYEGLQHEQFNAKPEPNESNQLWSEFKLKPGYFLWISNFYPYKQPDLLVRAYAALPQPLRAAHPLVMVGGDWENTREKVLSQVKDLGAANDVKFLGWVNDRWLAALYRNAVAFCLSSREETFGRCVIESMACGTPVVANDIPIMREVTAGNAMLVDFSNTPAVTALLDHLATDSEARSNLRQRGLRRAQEFTFERLVTERITAIRRMVNETKQRN